MTHSSRWLVMLSVSVIACGAMIGLSAQDDLDALMKDLGGQPKPAAQAPKPEAPAVAEKPAEAAPAAAQPVAEKPAEAVPAPAAEAAPAPAPVAAEKPAEAAPAPVAAEKPAEAAPAPAPVAAEKPAEAAPAAEKPAEAAAPAPAVTSQAAESQDSLVSELMTLETIRRKSLDDHGYASLEIARKALNDGDYALAREQYKQALDFIGNRPATVTARQEAHTGMAEAYYREAKATMKKGDYDKALPLAAQALEQGHPQAARLLETLKKEPAKTVADTTSISHRINEQEYKTQRDETRRRLRKSRQYYTTAEYDKALEECELVLRDTPYDTEAMELRDRIADRLKNVADVEFEATRSLMIRDVRKTWTPNRYAIESSQMPKGKSEMTSKQPVAQISGVKTSEQIISQKLREIVIPEVTFRPPATIIDAVDFFKQASRDYDNPEIPVEQRGVNLVLKLPPHGGAATAAPAAEPASADPFATPAASSAGAGGAPAISSLSARFINLYDALKLVCDVTGMKFRIRGNIVMIVPSDDPDEELITRSYNVLATLQERVGAASSELGNNAAAGGGAADKTFMATASLDNKQNWETFFQQMGVKWPTGASISYMATIGKLRVTNTAEQLAVFEQVLEDLNVTPRLIEIEARFVEVSQSDLNSLGFEWLLNSDFNFNAGGLLSNALDLQNVTSLQPGVGGGAPTQVQQTDVNGNYVYDAHGNPLFTSASSLHNASVNAIDGNKYSTGNRYMSTVGNPISGQGNSTPDQFMRVNAFLGNADLSMILHMLSQRSDTDLLSAPKVVTKSGQEAEIKVVVEYIYPTEFQVTGLTSSSGGNNSSSQTSGAVVEPQNFQTREVGVILKCVPEVSAEGQMINLLLNPKVCGEPTWKNYGAKIPIQKNSSIAATITGITDPATLKDILNPTPEYMELPMEQPFFPNREVNTQLSIYNGATVVMGGLITETRKSIDDKVPFLGDIPYVGRLFRSHSEQSEKRNLLIFVTARLVDPAGRAVRMSGGESSLMSGAAAQPHAAAAPAAAGAAPAAAPAAK